MVTVCTPTYKRFDTLGNLIDSVCAMTHRPGRIAVVDNSAGAMPLETFRARVEEVGIAYEVLSQSHNIGVAAAWNVCYTKYGRERNGEYNAVVMCNDDIVLAPNALDELFTVSNQYGGRGFFYGATGSANAFSMFYLPTDIYELVGKFDERFYPAYFEDNDYSYRLRLAGYSMVPVWSCEYSHVGSATLAALNPHERRLHDEQFNANARYYQQKWGGPPHHEQYQWPFNAAPTVVTGRIQ